jgi:CRISPR/Cas system-associated exonuclease Cas4 (RecB family)
MSPDAPPFVSASDLGDYAYCPRSQWYRHHPPPGGPSNEATRHSAAGTRAHAHQLAGERNRAEGRAYYWLLLVLGILVVVGGVLWLR